ncbi:MAG TPA: radical SAM protein [Chthonomonadales bacterium]|nr:radical SAM protein [Chthonomonadales bacterium]
MRLITEIHSKSLLTQQTGANRIPYDYAINPYRGCLFGCSYCYASKFVHDSAERKANWGDWVEVKKNSVELLARESHKLAGKTVFLASATDPYQPVELKLRLTRALLEQLLFSFPARLHIQTRSPFIVRDIDLLLQFGSTLTVGFSIPTDSETVRKAFEPAAPSIPRRLKAGRELKEAGIRTIASIAPLLPCKPQRLERMLRPCFSSAWVGRLNFYEKADALLKIYNERGWARYLQPQHAEEVRQAICGMRDAGPP